MDDEVLAFAKLLNSTYQMDVVSGGTRGNRDRNLHCSVQHTAVPPIIIIIIDYSAT
jgi:hypothetical protein